MSVESTYMGSTGRFNEAQVLVGLAPPLTQDSSAPSNTKTSSPHSTLICGFVPGIQKPTNPYYVTPSVLIGYFRPNHPKPEATYLFGTDGTRDLHAEKIRDGGFASQVMMSFFKDHEEYVSNRPEFIEWTHEAFERIKEEKIYNVSQHVGESPEDFDYWSGRDAGETGGIDVQLYKFSEVDQGKELGELDTIMGELHMRYKGLMGAGGGSTSQFEGGVGTSNAAPAEPETDAENLVDVAPVAPETDADTPRGGEGSSSTGYSQKDQKRPRRRMSNFWRKDA